MGGGPRQYTSRARSPPLTSPHLVISPRASQELREAFVWYDGQRRGLGDEFLHAVDALFEKIVGDPHTFPVTGGSVRRALLQRFPYGLFFAEELDTIIVLAAIHARRDPRQWPSR